MAPQDQPRMAEAFQRTLQGALPNDLECLALKKDGSMFLAEFNGTMVKDETGKPQAVICIGRDITARKEAENILREAKDALAEKVIETTAQLKETSDRLEELVKHGPTVIYSYQADGDHTITYISGNVVALLGYEPSELIKDINYWERVHPEDKARIFVLSEQLREAGRVVSDYRFLTKEGTYRWLRDERVLIRDMQGNPLEYVGSWSDITDRKKTEETLKNSEAKYRTLYESMMDAYVSVGMDGRINEFNHAYENMLGYAPDELHELSYIDLTPKVWHAFENEIVGKQVLPRGYSEIYEKEYTRKDGTVFPVELRTVLIRDESGNPSGMWAIVRDISGRKLTERTLRESEGRHRDLLDNSMQGVIVFQNLRIVYVNQAVTESLGYSQAELETLKPAEIIKRVHPGDRHMFQKKLRKHLDGIPTPQRYSLRVIHKNGETRWVEARTMQIELQGKPALMITAIDVTEIRQADVELKESARILQTIINASNALVFLADTNGILIASNDKFAMRMGIPPDAVEGISLYDILPEEMAMARKIPFEQAISTRKRIIYLDSREGIWFENSINPILDESGKAVSVAVFVRDISEQRRVTEALRASEEQYRTLAEASHDIIFTITRDDRISYVNSFGAKLVGLEPQQMVGQPRERFFQPVTNQHQDEYIQRVLKSGQAISSESANFFPTGTVWLNTWLVPLKGASGEFTSVLGVARDITLRKQSEEAIQQARDQLEERVAERTKELSASQEKLRILTAQTITAQEEERRVISRELHDEAGQALITLKYGLAAIQSELPESEAIPRQRLSDSMKIIDQTMVHIRALAHRLRPPVLEIGGIHLSLQDYCRELTGRTNIPIYYQGMDIPGLPDEIGISLFRFVQEALTNIMKHAHATEVKIRLQLRKAEISLSVSDNGHGIADSGQTEGLGLQGIKERLNLLGGKLEVHSKKGRGAKLVARIPWMEAGNK
jgi:PAS domain S-box-containing protein